MLRYRLATPLLISLFATLILTGCDATHSRDRSPVSFVTDYAPISFTFPAGWKLNPRDNPFDLQVFSKFEKFNTGVFVFKDTDLTDDSAPLDIFKRQIDDLGSKRDNFRELEPIRTSTLDDRTITSHTFVGEKDAAEMCYHFSLIEFGDDKSKFAVTYQIAGRNHWPKIKTVFEQIISSATPLPNIE